MSRNTRYDRLKAKIDKDFTRATTLAPAIAANGRAKLIDLDEHESSYALDSRFEKFGPFNAVRVRNFTASDIRVYVSGGRDSYVTVPGDTAQAVPVLEAVPKRYVRFLEVEELDGTAVDAGDVEVQVGNELDSVELTLMRDSGILDV